MTRRACLLVGALAFGCARLGAGRADADAYRLLHTAPSVEERLVAAQRYLDQQPSGAYRPLVQRWLEAADERWVQEAREDPVRLEWHGRQGFRTRGAEQAAQRLTELRIAERYAQERARASAAELLAAQQRLERAEQGRALLLETVRGWTERFAQVRSLGQPSTLLEPEWLRAFRASPPPPRCTEQACVRALSLAYAIPDGGRVRPRVALVDVVLAFDALGRVEELRLTGPALWARVAEALALHPVSAEEGTARHEALAGTARWLEQAVEPALPAARCQRPSAARELLWRRCDGVELVARVEQDAELEDSLVLRRAPEDAVTTEGGLAP